MKTESVWIVEALRWGDRENHSYVVGVFEKEFDAKLVAGAETDNRGGKYECIVREFKLNKVTPGIRYFTDYYEGMNEQSQREDYLRTYEERKKYVEESKIYSKYDHEEYFKNYLDEHPDFVNLTVGQKRLLNIILKEKLQDEMMGEKKKLMQVLTFSDFYKEKK